jgi:hypothetical protein
MLASPLLCGEDWEDRGTWSFSFLYLAVRALFDVAHVSELPRPDDVAYPAKLRDIVMPGLHSRPDADATATSCSASATVRATGFSTRTSSRREGGSAPERRGGASAKGRKWHRPRCPEAAPRSPRATGTATESPLHRPVRDRDRRLDGLNPRIHRDRARMKLTERSRSH